MKYKYKVIKQGNFYGVFRKKFFKWNQVKRFSILCGEYRLGHTIKEIADYMCENLNKGLLASGGERYPHLENWPYEV